jgi:plastocyanin
MNLWRRPSVSRRMDSTSLRPARALALAAALLLGLAGCGGDDGDATAGDTATTAAPSGGNAEDDYGSATDDGSSSGDDGAVVAQGVAFANDLTVEAGAEFTFDNQDSTAHTLTADDGSFDTGAVPGSSQSDPIAAPLDAGEYPFHCEIHPVMTGTLTVS